MQLEWASVHDNFEAGATRATRKRLAQTMKKVVVCIDALFGGARRYRQGDQMQGCPQTRTPHGWRKTVQVHLYIYIVACNKNILLSLLYFLPTKHHMTLNFLYYEKEISYKCYNENELSLISN
jgi:hypothetical protein